MGAPRRGFEAEFVSSSRAREEQEWLVEFDDLPAEAVEQRAIRRVRRRENSPFTKSALRKEQRRDQRRVEPHIIWALKLRKRTQAKERRRGVHRRKAKRSVALGQRWSFHSLERKRQGLASGSIVMISLHRNSGHPDWVVMKIRGRQARFEAVSLPSLEAKLA